MAVPGPRLWVVYPNRGGHKNMHSLNALQQTMCVQFSNYVRHYVPPTPRPESHTKKDGL